MLKPLTDAEKDYAYSQGLLEAWLDEVPQIPEKVKQAVHEALATLVGGISAYREKYLAIQEDYDRLLAQYNSLMAQSATQLQIMQSQKEQLDQELIDQQRPLHPEYKYGPKKGIIDV
jgi:hypothetical protein